MVLFKPVAPLEAVSLNIVPIGDRSPAWGFAEVGSPQHPLRKVPGSLAVAPRRTDEFSIGGFIFKYEGHLSKD